MQDEILECFAISAQFAAHATYAGTPRQAIADGYSAVDAAFSAVLISSGVKPSKVHKAKFDQVKSNFPKLLDGYTEPLKGGARSVGGVEWQQVESFYREFNSVR